ncbi:putative Endosomal cargo receptor [Taphrina deformans PYCC 5710]|uniref:Endosomal cargo receptor n=1 Tax=Taphrina deformans (strain PYCC 5710 / ATCC 11124 / CBS 356.35 / IMI 108563 / JCM 9778 / NBRC 8474) TaxID=1097556 RepID=R4XCH5_TAPDE|nr:putative Endosomal cargo receptor [Taphrina deformans PYCC 5710]|eukprot:CCG83301.1 putative Endosomal cargo receptor [Taphrina deformans PYCC 5710]
MGGFFFLFALILDIALLFGQVFFTIMFQDLASDYINPIDLVNRLNPYILPEAAGQAFLTLLLLVSGNWISFVFWTPIVAFNAQKIVKKEWQLDATEIFRTLNRNQRESFVKLGFYTLMFFWFLFQMITAFVADES